MDQAFDDSIKLAVSLLSILNPIGVIPIFLALTESFSVDKVHKIATSCALTVVITLGISLLMGQGLLDFFGISIASFTIGGGILIFTMALQMISAQQTDSKMSKEEEEGLVPGEIGIVPLAIPLLSGPGTISTTIIYSSKLPTTIHWIGAIATIIFAGFLVKFVFHYARRIGSKLGTIGLNVMTRVMGLILLAISIEMIFGGIRSMLPGLQG
jgi:multiple antibiotic resistance protein